MGLNVWTLKDRLRHGATLGLLPRLSIFHKTLLLFGHPCLVTKLVLEKGASSKLSVNVMSGRRDDLYHSSGNGVWIDKYCNWWRKAGNPDARQE